MEEQRHWVLLLNRNMGTCWWCSFQSKSLSLESPSDTSRLPNLNFQKAQTVSETLPVLTHATCSVHLRRTLDVLLSLSFTSFPSRTSFRKCPSFVFHFLWWYFCLIVKETKIKSLCSTFLWPFQTVCCSWASGWGRAGISCTDWRTCGWMERRSPGEQQYGWCEGHGRWERPLQSPKAHVKSLLLSEQLSSADPHTVSGNSLQQGRIPNNVPGTSSKHRTPKGRRRRRQQGGGGQHGGDVRGRRSEPEAQCLLQRECVLVCLSPVLCARFHLCWSDTSQRIWNTHTHTHVSEENTSTHTYSTIYTDLYCSQCSNTTVVLTGS